MRFYKGQIKLFTKSTNVESVPGLNFTGGNGKLQRALHFSLLLTMEDSLILLEAADLRTQQTFLQEKELFYL